MRITTDWHIHSHHSCECHEIGMTLAEMIEGASRHGITDFGVTDHLHSRYNLPDIVASREEFLTCDPSPRFHFGIEVTCMRRWELEEIATGRYESPIYGLGQDGPQSEPAIDLDREMITTYGIEFVVGGVHWARGIEPRPQAVIDFFHAQNMFLAACGLVDIVAHPWWWHDHFKYPDGGYVAGPWVEDFGVIPKSYHDEFAAALVESDTACEISYGWVARKPHGRRFFQQYMDYLAYLKEKGVTFAVGSDCHRRPYRAELKAGTVVLERLGITADELWCLAPRLAAPPKPVRQRKGKRV